MNNEKQASSAYQYTKAIRFRVEPTTEIDGDFKSQNQTQMTVQDFVTQAENFHSAVKALLIYSDSKNTEAITDKITINKSWLKQFLHSEFYGRTKKGKTNQYNLKDLSYVKQAFNEWLHEWQENTKNLKELVVETQEEQQERRSEIARCIQRFLYKKQFPFIKNFLNNATHKTDSKTLQKVKKQCDLIKNHLQDLESQYLPAQTAGVVVAQASFNYHTVNKKPKNYDEELKQLNKQFNETVFSTVKENKNFDYQWNIEKFSLTFKSQQEKDWVEYYFQHKFENGKVELTHLQTYDAMKDFKAEQKALFYEVIKHVANNKSGSYTFNNENFLVKDKEDSDKKRLVDWEYSELSKGEEFFNENFSLFEFTGEKQAKSYEHFLKLEQQIEQKVAEKNKAKASHQNTKKIQDEIVKLKKKKGDYLFGKYAYFSGYSKFCEKYKKVAMDLGKIKASIKGIEKERLEATNTKYWSVIWEEKNQETKQADRFLWLIPKDAKDENKDLKKAQKFITNHQSKTISERQTAGYVHYFESLTMRALHKLCFAEESSFVKGMKDKKVTKGIELLRLAKDAKEFKTDGDEQKIKEKDDKKLKYLKAVLQSEYAQKQLKLAHFDIAKICESESLDEFEMALEKNCYFVGKVPFDTGSKNHLIKSFHVVEFKIDSYDLSKHPQNTHQTPESRNRSHTEFWQEFWQGINQSDHNIRLNPEFKIRYRQADENLQKYLTTSSRKIKKPFDLNKIRHRKAKEQWTVNFTFALNAGKKYAQLAFAKPEEIRQKINEFNNNFNKQGFDGLWRFGIDRGNIELATLCIAQFNQKETYEYNGTQHPKPSFPTQGEKEIHCVELKKEFLNHEDYRNEKLKQEGRKSKIIDNLSYFIERKEWFEEKSPACIDLTTAKVIKGQIVLNGDIRTYLKLKKENAKRKIYDLFSKGQIESLHWIDEAQGLLIPSRISEDEFKSLKEKEKTELQIYFYSDKFEKLLAHELDENIKKYPDSYLSYGNIEAKSDKDKEKAKILIHQSLTNYLNDLIELRNKREEAKSQGKEYRKANLHTPTIDKLNHLRDSIVANMVGGIMHLYQQYPGLIILEDIEKKLLDKHFDQHNQNISRRLEWALYKKFQGLGKVPPHIKDIIQLREDIRKEKSMKGKPFQLGAIIFTDRTNTSDNCPYCAEKWTGKNKNLKWKQQYLCGDHEKLCGFDTDNIQGKHEFLSEINDPDKVAAYNVAKKIQKPGDIEELPLPALPVKNGQENKKGQQNGNAKHSSYRNNKSKNHHIDKDDSTYRPFAGLKWEK